MDGRSPTPRGTRKPRPPYKPPHGCGGCEERWAGHLACHCSACHLTFTGVEAFDDHRSAQYKLGDERMVRKRDKETQEWVMVPVRKRTETRPCGQCYDPTDSGLVLKDNGQWGSPDTDNRWEK